MHVTLIGHTDDSLQVHPAGFGEISDTQMLAQLLRESGHQVTVHDAYRLAPPELLPALPAIIDGKTPPPPAPHYDPGDLQIFLTFPSLLGLFCAQGLARRAPSISRLYSFDDFSHVHPHLHRQMSGVIVANPTAFHQAAQQGIPLEKLLYLPLQRLGEPSRSSGELIGCVTRLRYGKHVDLAIESAERLDLRLYVKGQLDPSGDIGDGEGHTDQLQRLLALPHVIWDRSRTPHHKMPQIYSQFRAGVLLSSYEDPSNVTVEQLSCGVPMLLLDGEPRRSLYGGLARFAEHQGETRMAHAYAPLYRPNRSSVEEQMRALLDDPAPDPELLRRRFGPDLARERLPLLWQTEERLAAMRADCARFELPPPTLNPLHLEWQLETHYVDPTEGAG